MVKTASLHSRTYIYGSEVKRIYTDRTANMYGRKEKTKSTETEIDMKMHETKWKAKE